MAKFWSDRGAERGPSLRGRVIFDTYNGRIRARAWPRPKRRRRTQAELEREAWFAQANRIDRYAPTVDKEVRRKATAGTVWMPRDPLVKQLAGQLIEPELPDGTRYRSMSLSRQASEALDYITDKIGSILVRGEDGWRAATMPEVPSAQEHLSAIATTEGALLVYYGGQWIDLPTGADGQVLVWDGDNGRPAWQDADLSGGDSGGDTQDTIANPDLTADHLPYLYPQDVLTRTQNDTGGLDVTWPATTDHTGAAAVLRAAPSENWRGWIGIDPTQASYTRGLFVRNSGTGEAVACLPRDYYGDDASQAIFDPTGTRTYWDDYIQKTVPDPAIFRVTVNDTETEIAAGSSTGQQHKLYSFSHANWIGKPDQFGAGFHYADGHDSEETLTISLLTTEILS